MFHVRVRCWLSHKTQPCASASSDMAGAKLSGTDKKPNTSHPCPKCPMQKRPESPPTPDGGGGLPDHQAHVTLAPSFPSSAMTTGSQLPGIGAQRKRKNRGHE